MIFITGDTHGDIERFKKKELKRLRKNDSLIICGDFGFVWDGSKAEKKRLKKLGKKRYNVLFVEGVHENFRELEKYETEYWCGGLTRRISGNLRQLIRGNVFELCGKRVFAFGGGRSDENDPAASLDGEDTELRLKAELPSDSELEQSMKNLAACGNTVDYIVSYEPPAKISEFIELNTDRSHINTFLEQVREQVSFTRWFFGRHHINKLIPPKFQAVFDSIVDADGERSKRKRK